MTPYQPENWRGVKPEFPLTDADTGAEIAPAGTKISARNAKKFADAGLKTLLLAPEALTGKYLARDLVNIETGEIYAEGRRRAGSGSDRGAGRTGLHHPGRARHRRRQHWRLCPQYPEDRQELRPRGRPLRHLPSHATGRAADRRRRPRRCSSRCSSMASATISHRSAV